MNRFPKVAFVAGTLGRGGAERQLYYMAKALVDQGSTPTVLSLGANEHWEAPLRDLGVDVHWFGRSDNPVVRVATLVRMLRDIRPDVVQSAHFHTNLYTVASARALRLPEVGAIRNDTHWSVESLGRWGRVVTAQSAPSRGQLASWLRAGARPRASQCRSDASSPTWWTGSSSLQAAPHDGPLRLLSVARLVPAKRHDIFLRLIARLVEDDPSRPVEAVIVGGGPLRDDLGRTGDRARTRGLRELPRTAPT